MLDNEATASSTNAPDASDDASINCQKPNLTIDKTPDAQNINAGEDVSFTIQVDNSGPGTAKAVTLTDTLPSGTAGNWVEDPDNPDCSITGNDLTCDFGDMIAGASKTVTVTAPTSFANCGTYNNTATASATNAGEPVDDSGQVTCEKPDLTVEKTPDAGTVNAGENVEFTIQVNNAGPGAASTVTLNDPLPAGVAGNWTIGSQPVGDPCSIAADVLSCDFGTLASGESVSVTVQAATDYDNCTVYDNTATASSTNAPNDSDDGKVTCQKSDLVIEKTPDAQVINAGDDVVFTIDVTNNGPGLAKAVKVSDTLPAGVIGDSWVEDPDNPLCEITGGNQLDCDFGDLGSGEGDSVTVRASTDIDNCATYDNTANYTSTNAPNGSDDGQVTCKKPGLGVIKTSVQGTINAGENAVFTIQVQNTGEGTANGVTLNDPLPTTGVSGPWVVSGTDSGACVSPIVGNTLVCDFGDLTAGQSRTVTVTAPTDFENCSLLENEATASSINAPDDSDDATINCQKPNLTIAKTPDAQTINAGDDVSFTIQVDNSGPGTAKAVMVTDTLPSGTAGAWVESPDNPDCSIAGNDLTCNFGDMAAGASKTITVTAPTSFANCGVYDNTATASASNAGEPVDDSGQVSCEKPNLTIVKTPNAQTINAGDDVVFSMQVDNSGPGTAKAVTLSDTLPSGTAGNWVEDPNNPDCQINGNQLSCDFGDMAEGASKTVTVKAPTSFDSCGTYNNTATASASNHPNVSDPGQVSCQKPNVSVQKTGNGTVSAGEDVTFTMVASNAGPGVAKNVVLADQLPTGTVAGWQITDQPQGNPCMIANGLLACVFGDMAAAASNSVTISAATDADSCATYNNTATATSTNAPDASDSATDVCQKPNLQVAKTGNGNIKAGEDVTFSIQVTNAGPGTATSVALSDPLPTGTVTPWEITSQPAAGSCEITDGTLNCAFGDLAAGASVTVAIKAPTGTNNCEVYDNTATATATNGPDASSGDTVTCSDIKPNVVLTKQANKKKVQPGANVKYTIKVKNTKDGSVAKNLKVCDKLPSQMTVVKKGKTAFFDNGRLCWNVKKLAGGKTKKFTYTAKVNNGVNAGTKLKNVVTVGNEKATKTVRVKKPKTKPKKKKVPVTG